MKTSPIHVCDLPHIISSHRFKRSNYVVEIKYVGSHQSDLLHPSQLSDIRSSGAKALQVFDVALRECMRREPGLAQVGRSYFRPGNVIATIRGVDLCGGWHQVGGMFCDYAKKT